MRRWIVIPGCRPGFWLSLMLTWALISALRSWHTPWARAAGTEALHWGAGIALALTLGYGLHRPQLAAQTLTALLAALVTVSIAAGLSPSGQLTGPFRDHQLCASALLLLLPFAVALAVAGETPSRRWGAQIVSLAATTCLVLSQTRSAWMGAVAAALVFAGYWLRHSRTSSSSHHHSRAWIVPALLATGVAGSFAAIIAQTDLGQPLAARAGTLQAIGRDESWQGRVQTWRGAIQMIPARPVAGWGLGRYAGAQWAWTHQGRPLAASQRPSLSEQAHDFYLQTTVEMGGVGLALYVAVLCAAFVHCRRSLDQFGTRRRRLPQALLIATLALLVGQAVDAIASPSYQFPEVSLLFWAGLGVGLAAANRLGSAEETAIVLPPPIRRALRVGAVAIASVSLVAQVLPLGLLTPVEAYTPGPGLTYKNSILTASNNTTSAPTGALVTYRLVAHYQDGAGNDYYQDVSTESTTTFTAFNFAQGFNNNYSGAFSHNVMTVPAPQTPATYPFTLTVRGHFYDATAGQTYPTTSEDKTLYLTLTVTKPPQ